LRNEPAAQQKGIANSSFSVGRGKKRGLVRISPGRGLSKLSGTLSLADSFAISVFPDELYQAPHSWPERAYSRNLIHDNRLDRGGHFAVWEQPDLFAAEMRDSFRSLR
jgi:pimeloyl-ACP methyl ester carboxylesterase